MDTIPRTLEEHRQWWADQRPDIPYGHCWCGCNQRTDLAKKTKSAVGKFKGFPLRVCLGHGPRALRPRYLVKERGHTTPCWIWQRCRDLGGYGKFLGTKAHRVYYAEAYGPIPPGMTLDHLCRQRSCVNPEHLEPVTQTENIRRGAGTKLTMEKARSIRQLDAQGNFTRDSLAARFLVSKVTISHVLCNRNWKDS